MIYNRGMVKKKGEVVDEHGAVVAYNWLADFVYAGMDGAVSAFAVVAGVEGASLSPSVVLILGFASLFAGGFSMSVGKYSSDKAKLEHYEKIEETEYKHIEERKCSEKAEVKRILADYGMEGRTLNQATKAVTSDPKAWVDLMMRNEFNMTKEHIIPWKGGVSTFISYIFVGVIPLLGYVLAPILALPEDKVFVLACFATFIALFIVGAVRAKFSLRNWMVSGVETVFVGGCAASIAYFVGYLLS